MAFTDMDNDDLGADLDASPEGAPPEESGNRTFVIVAAALGGIMLLALICLGVLIASQIVPRQRSEQATRQAVETLNAEVAFAATETAIVLSAITPTPTSTITPKPATPTQRPTNTPVLAEKATNTPIVNQATIDALNTQVAAAEKTTPTPSLTPSNLGKTGFAEDVGLPGLVGLAIVLVVVVFLARRLRTAS